MRQFVASCLIWQEAHLSILQNVAPWVRNEKTLEIDFFQSCSIQSRKACVCMCVGARMSMHGLSCDGVT